VSPPSRLLLHDADRTSCTRPMLERQVPTDPYYLLMRAPEREMQESQWVEQGMRRMPERFKHYLLRNLRRARAVGVPAHAIGHQQDGRVFRDGCCNFVLVLFARPEETDISVLDVQGGTHALLDWARFISRPARPSA
jgi:hypothetical protein